MIINGNITASNGVTAQHHKVTGIRLTQDATVFEFEYESWPTQSHKENGNPPVARGITRIPVIDLAGGSGFIADLKGLLVSAEYMNGTLVDEGDNSLEGAKVLKWAEIKTERGRRRNAGVTWNGHVFDSDLVSQSNVMGAVLEAQLAIANELPFSKSWTLADDSVLVMTAADVIGMGMSMGAMVGELYATAQGLREEIFSKTSIEDVQAVTWPS